MKPGPSRMHSTTSKTTIYQPPLNTVVAIHAPKLFGIRLLLILLGASAVDPESHGCWTTNVSARQLHVKRLHLNFQLNVFVVPCHALGQISQLLMFQ